MRLTNGIVILALAATVATTSVYGYSNQLYQTYNKDQYSEIKLGEKVKEKYKAESKQKEDKAESNWKDTHEILDFSFNEFKKVNSSTVLANDGKAIKIHTEQYAKSLSNQQQYYKDKIESDLYLWTSGKRIYQYKCSKNREYNYYTVVNIDGIGYRYSWDTEGNIKTTLITDVQLYLDSLTSISVLFNSSLLDKPSVIDNKDISSRDSATHDSNISEASYYIPIQNSKGIYNVYFNDNMIVEAYVSDNNSDTYEMSTVDIVDIPKIVNFSKTFKQLDTVEYTIRLNEKDYKAKVITGYPVIIADDDNKEIKSSIPLNLIGTEDYTQELKINTEYLCEQNLKIEIMGE